MDGAHCLFIVFIHGFFMHLTSFHLYSNPHLKNINDSQRCYITIWQVYIHISVVLLVISDPKCLTNWIYDILLPVFDSIHYKLKCTSSWQILMYLKVSMLSLINSSHLRLNITTPFNCLIWHSFKSLSHYDFTSVSNHPI